MSLQATAAAETLRVLCDHEALRDLKARYASYADAKFGADLKPRAPAELREAARSQAACFSVDAVWEGGDGFGGDLHGREALEEWFAHPPWNFAAHLYGSPIFSVNGDTARGRWRLQQVALRAADGAAVLLIAVTDESYVRHEGAWLISRMRFEQLHMLRITDHPIFLDAARTPDRRGS